MVIATAIAVLLGGAAIALANQNGAPTGADLPRLSTSRMATGTPVAVSPPGVTSDTPSPSATETPDPADSGAAVRPSGGTAGNARPRRSDAQDTPPAIDIEIKPAPKVDKADSDKRDEHEVVAPPVREGDDSDDDSDDHSD